MFELPAAVPQLVAVPGESTVAIASLSGHLPWLGASSSAVVVTFKVAALAGCAVASEPNPARTTAADAVSFARGPLRGAPSLPPRAAARGSQAHRRRRSPVDAHPEDSSTPGHWGGGVGGGGGGRAARAGGGAAGERDSLVMVLTNPLSTRCGRANVTARWAVSDESTFTRCGRANVTRLLMVSVNPPSPRSVNRHTNEGPR